MSSLAEQMNADALEAMKFTRKHFVVELDFLEPTIEQIERLVDDVEFALAGGKSEDNVALLTRTWGAYLGEVLRRNVGGEWNADDDGKPALCANDENIFPHDAVRRRMLGGRDDSIVKFYEHACEQLKQGN